MATKPQLQIDRFDPRKRSPREQQTERAYRLALREKLMGLLGVMNPQDQIHFGAMSYEDLVVYARDWLQTEVEEVSPNPLRGLESSSAPSALPL